VNEDSRHLPEALLDDFIRSRARTAIRIPGVPEIQLVFPPGANGGVAMRAAWDGTAVPDLVEYEHLSANVVRTGSQAWAELLIDDPDAFRRALPLVWRIADRIQIEQHGFARAVTDTLADFRELLEGAAALPADREVGLFGELTVLDCLLSAAGGTRAVAAWRGPNSDEHDFDLGNGDLEVKTTTSERRVHWIGSISQLEPSPSRPLWVLSVQVTTGLAESLTVSGLIGKLRSRLTDVDLDAFEKKLQAAGWRNKYGIRPLRGFALRSRPLLLPVNAEFPALTLKRMAAVDMPLARLREISYSVDVADLAEEPCPPDVIRQLVTEGGSW
jgi:hypothetical protein